MSHGERAVNIAADCHYRPDGEVKLTRDHQHGDPDRQGAYQGDGVDDPGNRAEAQEIGHENREAAKK